MWAWLRQCWGWIRSWWAAPQKRQTTFLGVAYVEPQTDPSAEIARRKLVFIGSTEKPKWLRFSCPCNCGAVIALNLMRTHSPHWRAEVHDDGGVTVYPSVDATDCGSHFWIRRSRIDWV